MKTDQMLQKIKVAIKRKLEYENHLKNLDKAKTLIKKGNLLSLAMEQNSDLDWKAIIFDVKKGLLKFALNSTVDTLPTNANLVQWGKRMSDKCKNCGGKETLLHILNYCKTSLDQDRFTWRHDNILNYVYNTIDKSRFEIYVDLEEKKSGYASTIPPEIMVTSEKPDIVIVDRKSKKVHIFELTVPFETNIEKQHEYKQNKYAHFEQDIEAEVIAFEIGSRGYISPENRTRLNKSHGLSQKGIKFKIILFNLTALSLNSSYYIYLNRKEPQWMSPLPLKAIF